MTERQTTPAAGHFAENRLWTCFPEAVFANCRRLFRSGCGRQLFWGQRKSRTFACPMRPAFIWAAGLNSIGRRAIFDKIVEKGIFSLIIVKIFTKSNSKYLYYANILKKNVGERNAVLYATPAQSAGRSRHDPGTNCADSGNLPDHVRPI